MSNEYPDEFHEMRCETAPGVQARRYRLLAVEYDKDKRPTHMATVEILDCPDGMTPTKFIDPKFLPMTPAEQFDFIFAAEEKAGPPSVIEYEITVRRITPSPGSIPGDHNHWGLDFGDWRDSR